MDHRETTRVAICALPNTCTNKNKKNNKAHTHAHTRTHTRPPFSPQNPMGFLRRAARFRRSSRLRAAHRRRAARHHRSETTVPSAGGIGASSTVPSVMMTVNRTTPGRVWP